MASGYIRLQETRIQIELTPSRISARLTRVPSSFIFWKTYLKRKKKRIRKYVLTLKKKKQNTSKKLQSFIDKETMWLYIFYTQAIT